MSQLVDISSTLCARYASATCGLRAVQVFGRIAQARRAAADCPHVCPDPDRDPNLNTQAYAGAAAHSQPPSAQQQGYGAQQQTAQGWGAQQQAQQPQQAQQGYGAQPGYGAADSYSAGVQRLTIIKGQACCGSNQRKWCLPDRLQIITVHDFDPCETPMMRHGCCPRAGYALTKP